MRIITPCLVFFFNLDHVYERHSFFKLLPIIGDSEVIWDNVRVLKSSGETVSTAGTHLGHNLPDGKGNRYCINLVSVAGNPA